MTTVKKVAVTRHGEKKKNELGVELLSYKGAWQIINTCHYLLDNGMLMPSKVIYSGADRTLQCATYAQLAFDLEDTVPEIHRGFFQDDLIIKCFGGDFDAFVAEIKGFYGSGKWSVEHALQVSEFARQARAQIQKSVIEVAEHHGDSIVFSHSPMGNLGTTKPEEVEYDYGLAHTVLYYVERGKIVDSEYISCPPEEE